MLTKLIPGAVQVSGRDSDDEKEEKFTAFAAGQTRVLVTKPIIGAWGLNWQHANTVIFASVSHSYEQHYQAVRRSHRFGQSETVRNDIVIADTEAVIWEAVNAKSAKHDEMKRRMADAMKAAQISAARRVKYDRPLDLAFPEWIRSEK